RVRTTRARDNAADRPLASTRHEDELIDGPSHRGVEPAGTLRGIAHRAMLEVERDPAELASLRLVHRERGPGVEEESDVLPASDRPLRDGRQLDEVAEALLAPELVARDPSAQPPTVLRKRDGRVERERISVIPLVLDLLDPTSHAVEDAPRRELLVA